MAKASIALNHTIPPGHIRVGPLHAVPEVIRSLGGKLDRILRPLKLTEEFLSQPESAIPITVVGKLLYRAVQETGCEHFGLLVGSHSGINELGLPGKLISLCPTVAHALATLQKYLYLHDRGAIPLLHTQGKTTRLGYAVLDGNFPGIQELQDGAIAVALNIMRDLIDPHWCPAEVYLMRHAPQNPQAFADFFGAPCFFDAGRSELSFATDTLTLAVRGAQPSATLPAFVKEMCVAELAGRDWIEHVRRTTLGLLLTGNCTRQAVAESMGVSERTLNRNLEKAGASFLEIADHSRYAASRMLIKETDMPLGSIALLLGYSDPTSLSRAFKRWLGITPMAWRKTKIASSPP